MKQDFDKLGMFRDSLNALVKLNCNLSDYYTREQAITELQRLSKQWSWNEEYVILSIYQLAQSQVYARLRYMVQQAAEELDVPFSVEEFYKNWENLSKEEKIGLADSIYSLLAEVKKEGE